MAQGQPSTLSRPYDLILSLELDKARTELYRKNDTETIALLGLADALELLITENEDQFEKYEAIFEDRLDQLKKTKKPEAINSMAELRLQWAFVYLKFGHEFDAAWNLRQSYLLVQECKKKTPDYKPIRKTSGMLEVMLGSVPEKFQWILSLLNMRGSVEEGLTELKQLQEEPSMLGFEADLYYNLILGFILQRTTEADTGMNRLLVMHPNKKLLLFLGASVAIKNSNSRSALALLQELDQVDRGLPLNYAKYLTGEVYLHSGDYRKAIQGYKQFLYHYAGLNYRKDANYKIGVCHWLLDEQGTAKEYFDLAKTEGKESTEADKYAARILAEGISPNAKLSKIRYYTDGGYYAEADSIVEQVASADMHDAKEIVEFAYRKARLYHKSGSIVKAKMLYQETIELAGNESWYFAPNSCLQLGYILVDERKFEEAKGYFEKALGYKRHEYKNSIDAKAKSALSYIKESGTD